MHINKKTLLVTRNTFSKLVEHNKFKVDDIFQMCQLLSTLILGCLTNINQSLGHLQKTFVSSIRFLRSVSVFHHSIHSSNSINKTPTNPKMSDLPILNISTQDKKDFIITTKIIIKNINTKALHNSDYY